MIIISLQPESKEQIIALRQEYPGYYLEYRLDLTENWDFIDKDTVDERIILTIRSAAEAEDPGKQVKQMSAREKVSLYRKWVNQYNCLVDLELSSLSELSSPELLSLNPDNLILSLHIYEADWKIADIARLCLDMERSHCRFGKLALTSRRWHDINNLERLFRTAGLKFLVAFMGEDGISKRCLFKHIGAAGTYCSLPGRELSSGQFDVNLSEKLKLTSVSGKEQLGGLLGGRQILESKGLEYYTKLFRKRSLPAVYLPFLVEDEKEFSDWLAESIFKKRVYGFSVTMPLKLNVANLSNSRVQSANLWNGRKQIFNTDLRAMRLILKDKELTGINHRTLIIGSGASSITAIKALNGRGEISISSRNFPRACQLSREYGLQYIIPENLKGKYFDLLINTTPLGMNNENLLDFVPGVEFAAAIDLPYRKGMTPLGRYCMKNGLLYVSGGEFWHYQAIEQEHYFLSVIKRRLANG